MQDYEVNFPSPEIQMNLRVGSQQMADTIDRALAFDKAGDKARAFHTVNAALAEEPMNSGLYFLAARYLFDLRNLELAKETIEKALILDKKQSAYHKLKGDILTASKLYDQAGTAYRRALKIDKMSVAALNNAGNLSRLIGNSKDAKKYFKRAIACDTDYVPAHYNLALQLIEEGAHEQSEQELLFCIDKAPTVVEPWLTLEQLEMNLARSDNSLATLEKACEKNPNDVRLAYQLAARYDAAGHADSARQQYRKVNELNPDFAAQLVKNSITMMNRLEQGQAQQLSELAVKLDDRYNDNYRNHLFMSAYLAVLPPEQIMQNHRTWNDLKCIEARQQQFTHAARPDDRRTKRPIKIGYVSPDMHAHAISYFFRGILQHHDREKFEIYTYAEIQFPRDAVTAELNGLTDHWKEIQDLSDFEAANLIHDDDIDLLVDLSGHTRNSRVSLFAYKPAPVQVTYLGYPGSTGLTEMDYWITDEFIHPEQTPESSSETIYRLKRTWASYTNTAAPEITAKPPKLPITFGVINHIGKHSPEFIDTWVELLKRLPTTRILVKSLEFSDADLRIKVLDLLEARGLDRSRVQLAGQTATHQEHLNFYNRIDVCLDPFPYSGGTSTADALSMGTPVVTLAGDAMRGRMSASLLKSIGKQDWITYSVDDYIDKAISIAQAGVNLEMKEETRQRFHDSSATDARDLTRHLESAYLEMLSTFDNAS